MCLVEILAFAGREVEEREKVKARREHKRRNRKPLKM